jgi:hypothetical protein
MAEGDFLEANDMFDEKSLCCESSRFHCLIYTDKQTPLHKLSFAWPAPLAEITPGRPFRSLFHSQAISQSGLQVANLPLSLSQEYCAAFSRYGERYGSSFVSVDQLT